MKWIKFSDQLPNDDQDIIFYRSSYERIIPASFCEDGFVFLGTFCALTARTKNKLKKTTAINVENDYWMPLPSAPGKIRKTRSDKVIREEFHVQRKQGCLIGGIGSGPVPIETFHLSRKRKKKHEMD